MTDPKKTMADLWRRAFDPSATEGERAACLTQMGRLAQKKNLVHEVASSIEHGGSSHSTLMDEVVQAITQPVVAMTLLQAVEHNAEMLTWDEDRDIEAIPIDLRPEMLHVIALAAGWGAHAVARGHANMPSGLRKAIKRLVKVLADHRSPSAQKSERAQDIGEALCGLFASEGEIGGADTTAKRLGVRASDVREVLAQMIKDGLVKSVGKGRARRYRWVGAQL